VFSNKILKVTFFIITSFVGLTYLSPAVGQRGRDLGKPAKLGAELKIYKTEYQLREPIWVELKAINIRDEKGYFYFYTSLHIEDSKGQTYPCQVYNTMFPTTIEPQETLEYEFNVLNEYGIPEEDKFRIFRYLPPEKYTIYYHLQKNVKSGIYNFKVVQPEGEELKAMNLLKESYDLFIERKWEESTNKMREIFEKYPKSRYAPFSLLRTANTLQEFYELIENYPNSREAVRAVSGIADIFRRKKDKAGYIDSMNGLIKKFPNTDISKEAGKQKKQIKDKYFE